jgi:hypothetical protein
MVLEVFDVFDIASQHIIATDNLVPFFQQAVTEVRPNKPCAARHKRTRPQSLIHKRIAGVVYFI